jgi:hypothetical protein
MVHSQENVNVTQYILFEVLLFAMEARTAEDLEIIHAHYGANIHLNAFISIVWSSRL